MLYSTSLRKGVYIYLLETEVEGTKALDERKKTLVFATKANPTTRENISNVFGAKTLNALVSLDLDFEMQSKPRPAISGWTNKGEEYGELFKGLFS